MNCVTSSNLANRLSLGVTVTVGVDTLVMRAASTDASTLDASVCAARFCFVAMSRTASVLALVMSGTFSTTLHDETRPLGDSSGEAVVSQRKLRISRNPMRQVNVIRNPRRAPRLVPSSR